MGYLYGGMWFDFDLLRHFRRRSFPTASVYRVLVTSASGFLVLQTVRSRAQMEQGSARLQSQGAHARGDSSDPLNDSLHTASTSAKTRIPTKFHRSSYHFQPAKNWINGMRFLSNSLGKIYAL